MPVAVQPFRREHSGEVREFNNRVRASEGAFEFPESPESDWLPALPGRSIFQERFLALDRGEVRGGYTLKRQEFSFRGKTESIACYHSALSEGIAAPQWGDVGALLIQDASTRQPLLYALETNTAGPQPRLLREAGWKLAPVPSYLRIVHPGAFLRNMQALRGAAWKRFFLSLAAFTGIGGAAAHLYQRVKAPIAPATHVTAEFFDSFGPWADDLWKRSAPHYPFAAVRDCATLAILYPGGKFLRVRLTRGSETIGWAVALDTQMQWNRLYGDMRLGSIIDCMAPPEHAASVMAAMRRVLERRGVDLILCDHSHRSWGAALRSTGFLEGPSNFTLATSPVLTARLEQPAGAGELFLMRGDGDARALPELSQTLL
jgi:hypothetical protein